MTAHSPSSTLVTGSARSPAVSWLFAGAVLAVAAVPYLVGERFVYHIAILVCLSSIAAASLHLIIRTGHVSLCHAAFIGIGGYSSAHAMMVWHWPFPAAAAFGAGAAAAMALARGPVILRLTGKYFVLITFLFGALVRMVFVDWQAVTGGANGLSSIPPPWPWFADPSRYYLLALGCAAACIGIIARLLSSELGRYIDAIREGEQLAECAGVPVIRTKVMVFVIACGFAGFAGALMAHYARYVSPQAFGPIESLNYVIMNVIGGMNTLVGPLFGAVFLVIIPELLRGYVQLQQILFGAILIIVMAFLPGGLAELQTWKALLGKARGGRS
jgi:branched-chain amino acid transport system permease protein